MTHARIPDFSHPLPPRPRPRDIAAMVAAPALREAPAAPITARALCLAGEALAALAFVAGGAAVVGLATLL